MNKEISDSLHFLLHCSLKAVGFETQREQFEFIYKYIENLEKENQELKLELSGYRQAILKDKEMLGLKEENDKLKKQLEEYKRLGFKHLNDKCNKLENQQKVFIEYLEYLIKQNETVVEVSKYGLPKNCSKLLIDFYKEILSKYREIIGDDK